MFTHAKQPLFLRPKSKEAAHCNGRLQRLLSVDFSLPKNDETVTPDPHFVNAVGGFGGTYLPFREAPLCPAIPPSPPPASALKT